jgi:hypothetical protein
MAKQTVEQTTKETVEQALQQKVGSREYIRQQTADRRQ